LEGFTHCKAELTTAEFDTGTFNIRETDILHAAEIIFNMEIWKGM